MSVTPIAHTIILLLCALPIPLVTAGSQRVSDSRIHLEKRPDPPENGDRDSLLTKGSSRTELVVMSGLGLGAVGLISGVVIADRRTGNSETIWLSGLAGEGLMLPLGMHLAMKDRGSYVLSTLASVVIGVAGFAAADISDTPYPLLLAPIAQVYSVLMIERSTDRQASESSHSPGRRLQ